MKMLDAAKIEAQRALVNLHKELGYHLELDDTHVVSEKLDESIDRADIVLAGAMLAAEVAGNAMMFAKAAATNGAGDVVAEDLYNIIIGALSLYLKKAKAAELPDAH